MTSTVREIKPEYIFVVHEYRLIFSGIAAFRRAKDNIPYGRRKYAKCPYCSQRLFDMDPDTIVELFRYPERAEELHAHTLHKCSKCNSVVGVNYLP
jgi:DNA-directed RNA polymerase subunit RPC12/RpoP